MSAKQSSQRNNCHKTYHGSSSVVSFDSGAALFEPEALDNICGE